MNDTRIIATELERQIWEEELEDFVPKRVFDAHTHLWSRDFVTPQTVCNNDWLEQDTSLSRLREIFATLIPGRQMTFLSLPLPVLRADHDGLNRWVASEVSADGNAFGAMLITPQTAPETIAQMVEEFGFAALKPYHHFSVPGCTGIAAYLTPAQMEVADALELPVILHCRTGIADDLEELTVLATRYPGIRWVLAHGGATFNPRGLECVIRKLCDLPNLWCDTSLICETYPQALLLKHLDRKHILFGSDCAAGIGGCRRGKVASYSRSVLWHKDLDHAIFWLYEELRAMRRACELLEASPEEIEDLFYNNAVNLLHPRNKKLQ